MPGLIMLDDQRPHLTVMAEDGVHVLPVALIEDVIKGSQETSVLTDPVIRRIVEEWLDGVKVSV